MEFLISEPQSFLNFIRQPWHWSVSGIAIAGILFLMTWMGRSFGLSTAFKNFCNIAGAGKKYEFFNFDLKNEYWRLVFIAGAIGGGFIASTFLSSPEAVAISDATISHLENDFGISYPQGGGFLPESLFNFGNPLGVIISIVGGFLVGFGARYGDGCTSGHAISGLSHLQLPSLITVIGFFIGGLTMTWIIMPLIFG
ncbi:MAG: YeeE/YedE family protein [Bacteroidetes bacterium]|nr:YeeE/YedE family protein [Bacteroidota bacterium]